MGLGNGYIYELHKRESPERMRCPHHGREFKKHRKFWKCPDYWECGCSIGSRRLVGHVTTMWIKQTKKGRAWARAIEERREELWWDLFPRCFAAACFVALSWRTP